MAEYRTVRMAFWHDPYIEELDAKAKLLYLYLFTCPYANNLGIVEATRRKVAYETALSQAEVDKYLEAFEAAGKIVCDSDHNLVFLTNFIRHQSSTSPKILDGLRKLAPSISSPVIAKALCVRYPDVYDVDKESSDTVSIPYANGINTLCIPSGEIGSWKGEDGKGKMERGSGKVPRTRKEAPSRSEPASEKNKYGENGNVLLTPEEHKSLCQKFTPELTEKAIAFLDLHIGAKGKDEYKSHNLAMQKWVLDAVREREAKKSRASPPNPQGTLTRNMETTAAVLAARQQRRQGHEPAI